MIARSLVLVAVSALVVDVAVAQKSSGTAVPLLIGFDTLAVGQQKPIVVDPAGHFTVAAATKRGPYLYVERAAGNLAPMEGNYLALRPGTSDSSNLASIKFDAALSSGSVSFDYWVEFPSEHAAQIGCAFSNGHVESTWTGASVRAGSFRCKAPDGATVREIRLKTSFDGGVLRIDNVALWLDRALAGQ